MAWNKFFATLLVPGIHGVLLGQSTGTEVARPQSILFSNKIDPARIVTTRDEMVSTMVFQSTGDAEVDLRLRERFGGNPGLVLHTQSRTTHMQSGNRESDGSFGVRIEIASLDEQVTDREGTPIAASPSKALKGAVMQGRVRSDNQVSIVAIESPNLPMSEADSIKGMMTQLLSALARGDEKRLAVGDTFRQKIDQTVPVPMAGVGGLVIELDVVQRLKRIEPELAYFDVDYAIRLKTGPTDWVVFVEGSGNGELVYNHQSKLINEGKGFTSMKITLRSSTLQFSIRSQSRNRTTQSLLSALR